MLLNFEINERYAVYELEKWKMCKYFKCYQNVGEKENMSTTW